jgi:Protein of unknown function (DUF2950)
MSQLPLSRLQGSVLAVLLAFASGEVCAQEASIKTFPTYRAAAAAFVDATGVNDEAALAGMLGTKAQELLSSGDPTQDQNERSSFVKRYHEAHAFVRESPDRVKLSVGESAWLLPFPIVRAGGAWHFDADAGAEELIYRRIGQNELDAIRVVRALYAAQKSYAADGHDGNPAGVYAQRFRSQPGTQEGLYWETKEGEVESPAGAFIAEATGEGYETGRKRTPFHGYYYRILKAQGPHAPGGAKDYVIDGKMTGGFGIVAYPAEYRSSGVMTFVVGPKGGVFQKDLGETSEDAMKATVFDPDSTWHGVH